VQDLKTRRAVRSWLLNIAAGAIALLVSVGLGEIALRAVVTLPMRRVLPEIRYAPHPVRRFTLEPGQQAFSYGAPARVDERGFRSTEGTRVETTIAAKPILALGDSFTFGLGVRDEETWPGQLQTLLAHSPVGPVEVVNAGTISYGVFQELDLLKEKGLALNPRVVIHGLYWNDFMNAGPPAAGERSVVDKNGYFTWDQLQPRAGVRQLASRAISSSALLFSLKQTTASLTASGQSTGYGAAYDKFLQQGLADGEWSTLENFYRDVQTLGRSQGFEVLVAIMPVVDIVTGEHPERHPYLVEARRRLERLGVPYVDGFTGQSAATFLPQGRDAHTNAGGYRVVADAVARKLVAAGALAGPQQGLQH
jgi:lysophospholipase L1-like esterase